ncbi:MAG TPA: hypothetical protein VIJ91_13855 [Candidatus Dormibacteraeota bacterium]
MSIANLPRSKASINPSPTTPEAFAPTDPASPLPDLLAGLRWGTRELIVAGAVLVVVDVFAGWSYLASYFGYFRIPVEGLGLGLTEVLAQGLRSILLPLTVIVLAASAPTRRLRPAAIAVVGYLVFLAVVSLGNHWASPGSVAAQLAASLAIAGVVFVLRLGFGRTQTQRLIVGAVGLLLLISIPIASGTLDASQKAGTKTTTLRLVTSTAILPSAAPSTSGQFTYANYVLLREGDTRYWLFRVGDQYAYSIAKTDVLYIRY